jgi:enamine deaminase RidA (YjgF/YER057c/UK114 family)
VRIRRILTFLLASTLAVSAQEERRIIRNKNDDKEPVTQTLPAPKEPPPAVAAETARLVFRVSPLSSKGLMSQQVRDALKSLFRENHDAEIVKLRAFVAGSGDLRRVQTLVSEIFADRKMNLPAISTIQAGALPLVGAQVSIESIAVEKKAVNPNGLAFFSGQQAKDVRTSMTNLQNAVSDAGVAPAEVLRVTCFLSSLDDAGAARELLHGAFPNAAANFVQLQRLPLDPLAECEAVGRPDRPPAQPVTLLNPADLGRNPNYSQIAIVNAPKVILSGTQMAFGEQESDINLAFERLQKEIGAFGASGKDVFWSSVYPLTRPVADKIRAVRFHYFDAQRPPASTFLLFEGLPSLDASMAIEVMAAPM